MKKLFLGLSVLGLMGLSSVATAESVWRLTDSGANKPIGGCLERMCPNGCVEKGTTDGAEGHCCGAGYVDDKCYGGLCCQNNAVCSSLTDKGTCVCPEGVDSYTESQDASYVKKCCPIDKPKWHEIKKQCVQCLTDIDCTENEYCSTDNTCVSGACEIGQVWAFTKAGDGTFKAPCLGNYEVIAFGGFGGAATCRRDNTDPNRGSVAGGGAGGSVRGLATVTATTREFSFTVGKGGSGAWLITPSTKKGYSAIAKDGTTTVVSWGKDKIIEAAGGTGGQNYSCSGVTNKYSGRSNTPGKGGEAKGMSPLKVDAVSKGSNGSTGAAKHSKNYATVMSCAGDAAKGATISYCQIACGGWVADGRCDGGTGKAGYVHFKYLGTGTDGSAVKAVKKKVSTSLSKKK